MSICQNAQASLSYEYTELGLPSVVVAPGVPKRFPRAVPPAINSFSRGRQLGRAGTGCRLVVGAIIQAVLSLSAIKTSNS